MSNESNAVVTLVASQSEAEQKALSEATEKAANANRTVVFAVLDESVQQDEGLSQTFMNLGRSIGTPSFMRTVLDHLAREWQKAKEITDEETGKKSRPSIPGNYRTALSRFLKDWEQAPILVNFYQRHMVQSGETEQVSPHFLNMGSDRYSGKKSIKRWRADILTAQRAKSIIEKAEKQAAADRSGLGTEQGMASGGRATTRSDISLAVQPVFAALQKRIVAYVEGPDSDAHKIEALKLCDEILADAQRSALEAHAALNDAAKPAEPTETVEQPAAVVNG